MSEPIKLPPDLLAVTLVREGVNKHRARDIECWMNEKMTQAVEQATTELRAECEALRAELDRLTTLRPASEWDGETYVLWWREWDVAGWALDSISDSQESFYWTPAFDAHLVKEVK